MGYERTFRLAVVNGFGPDEKEQLRKLLRTDEMKYMYVFNERVKWYDFVKDMKLLSKSFPNTLFYGAYVGEDLGDNEYIIFHRGCSMPSPDNFAFKLPMSQKVQELTKAVRKNRMKEEKEEDSDSLNTQEEDLEQDLEDELTVEREKLIDNFFSQLNLVEISDLFDLEDSDEE